MAEPAVAESSGDAGDPTDSVTDEEEKVEMVQTDISTTGADPDGFFDGVDTDTGGGDTADSLFDGLDDDDSSDSSDSSGDDSKEASETRSSGLASDINAGVARAAVINLDDKWVTEDGTERKKTDLQKEFEETFEAFRLGHYASICAEEYLLMEAEDIHPVWGLIGAALICAAVIVYRRPDGDQIVQKAKMKLGSTDLSDITEKLKKDD